MIFKIIILLIFFISFYYIGKINGYNEGYIDGRLEEKWKKWK